MADPNISNILAALAAQRPNGTPTQIPPPIPGYPQHYGQSPIGVAPPYGLPQPINSGSVDLGAIKPVSSGTVSIADAIAKARGIAAEKGISYDPNRAPSRNADPRLAARGYQRSRSRSRSPPRGVRDSFRDNYNPYRDERRGGTDRNFNRERSFSPPRGGAFSPPGRAYGAAPGVGGGGGGGGDGDSEIIPIEKSLVGLIIGRSGENLRRVEQGTGARVQFMDGPESATSQRHCKISGNRSQIANAKSEIFRIIDDNEAAKRGQDKGRGRTKEPSVDPTGKDGDSLQIMVPDRTVGLIIGRGGETIRDLQERSGCHVNIVGENKSVSGMRPVNLIGPMSNQMRAKDMIFEIVESDTKTGPVKLEAGPPREDPYSGGTGKMNDSILVPGEAVGMIIGKGGESIKEMQNNTGCKINVSPASGRDIEREIGLVGTRQAIEAAKRAILDKVDAVEQRNRPEGGGGGGVGGSASVRRNDDYGDRYPGPPQQQYPPTGMPQQQQPGLPPQAGGADPYAPYGGYNAYLQMWYAAMQAQQQGGQGQGEQR